jgi:SM-20-related protein
MVVDLKRFEDMPLTREPFEFLVVEGFVPPPACEAINRDYPKLSKPGSFPLSEVSFGMAFRELIDALNSEAMRKAFEQKFGIDLTGRPSMITVRGRCSEKDGKIHTDSKTKIITVLLYMNPNWEQSGGRLRLLRSENDLDDVIVEVPPVEGTLLAFKRADNSWHGHKPFTGERRVIQFNWVTSDEVVRREQSRHRFSAFFKKLVGGSKAP